VELKLQCTKAFFPLNACLPPSLNSLHFSNSPLRRRAKNSSQVIRILWLGQLPGGAQRLKMQLPDPL
jgi:hypothetical protein